MGAAIGRQFNADLVAQVTGMDARAVREALEQLSGADLIHPLETAGGPLSVFRHALVRDAAYGALLRRERRELHGRIADNLERLSSDTAEPAVLARHQEGAGRTDEAVRNWQRAGERSLEQSANREAIEQLRRAIELLESTPPEPRRALLELDLYTTLGATLTAVEGFASQQVEDAYEKARSLCAKVGNPLEPLSDPAWPVRVLPRARQVEPLQPAWQGDARDRQRAAQR